jgi:murein DD-endopeptidase MepM/ murein hydrolase activator NlpD
VALIMLGTAVPSQADSLSDQRAQAEANAKAVKEALASLGASIEDTSVALQNAYAELAGLQAQAKVAEAQLQTAQDNLVKLQREADMIAQRLQTAQDQETSISTQIKADTDRASQLQAAIGQMARDAYKGDMATSAISAVLDAKNTADFVQQSELASVALRTQTKALRDVEQSVGINRNNEARLTAVREKITELKAAADANVKQAEVERQAAAEHKAQVLDLEAKTKAKTAEFEKQKADQLAKQQELKAQQATLAKDLAAIIAKQEAARRAAGKNPIGSTADQPFINPTSVNPIYRTSPYGMRFHPIYHIWLMHTGVDLRTYCNTPIYAAASGTVQWAKYRSGYGNQVMLNNGYWKGKSLMTSYNHLSSMVVHSGQTLAQGQLLGYAGTEGTSTGCHLHFEVYLNGSTTDPWPLIAK